MDRLLFGDNQFFGVNHMSEEKARAQAMRFQDIDAVIDVLDAAYDEGIRTFMCTTHDRIARGLRPRPRQPGALRRLHLLSRACPTRTSTPTRSPRTACSARVKRFLPDEGAARRGDARRHARWPSKDIEGITTLLIDAEMKMFAGPAARRSIFLQNVVVDLLLGLGFNDAFRIFADHVRERYDAEPGFITMNLPLLLDVLDEVGIENPIVCSNINKIGFRMCGGVEAYEQALRERRVPRGRDVGLRLRRDPAARGDRVGLRRSPTSSRSSSAPRAGATSEHTPRARRPSYWRRA